MACDCPTCEATAARFPAPKGLTAADRRLGRHHATPDEIAAIWTALGDKWRALVVRSAAAFPADLDPDRATPMVPDESWRPIRGMLRPNLPSFSDWTGRPFTASARAALARPMPVRRNPIGATQ